jgi:hypothetical protein
VLQAESIICPVACIGVFAWCIHYGGGLQVNALTTTAPLSGGALGWAMLNGINSCLGVTSALLVNVSAQITAVHVVVTVALTSAAATGSNEVHPTACRCWVATGVLHLC